MCIRDRLNRVCNFEGITSESTEIVFYVRHDRGTDEKNDVVNVAYNGYNIKTAIARFSALTGNEPKKVVVKVKDCLLYTSETDLFLFVFICIHIRVGHHRFLSG